MNATTRVSPDSAARSIANSLTTTTASSAAPTVHSARTPRRVDHSISASAVTVQVSVSAACTGLYAISASNRHATSPQ